MKRIKIIGKGRGYTKTVKRTYYSKRKGGYVTKEYKYENYGAKTSYTTRSQELIVKNGKLTPYGEEYVRDLKTKNKGWNMKIDELTLGRGDKNLTESALESRLERVREDLETWGTAQSSKHSLRQFLYNMGADTETLAADLGITEKELLNKDYWTFEKGGRVLFTFGGYAYTFTFNYGDEEIIWDKKPIK